MRTGPPGRPSSLHAALWAAATLLVLWWTLLPFTGDLSREALSRALADVQWVPFLERGRPPLWSDVLGNLALFLPFGVLGWRTLEGRRRRLALVIAAAAILSLGVELAQLALPARRTSATDLATDTVGAALGAGLGWLWETRARDPFDAWTRGLVQGDPIHVLTALFAACLLAWAMFPGSAAPAGLWRQTQGYASSFRRFPGWAGWVSSSFPLFGLGWLFGAVAAQSGTGGRGTRAVFGSLAAALLGLLLETAQLVGWSRRPDIYQAVAFGLGGIPGAASGVLPRPWTGGLCGAVLLAALLGPPGSDSPGGATWAMLLAGGLVAAWALTAPLPGGGAAAREDVEKG